MVRGETTITELDRRELWRIQLNYNTQASHRAPGMRVPTEYRQALAAGAVCQGKMSCEPEGQDSANDGLLPLSLTRAGNTCAPQTNVLEPPFAAVQSRASAAQR